MWKTNFLHFLLTSGIAFAIVIIGIVFAVLAAKGKIKHKPDYYVLFIMGVIWLPAGIAMKNYAFSILGLVFMIIGLKNKDKWKERRTWKDLNPAEKKFKMSIMILLGALLLIGLGLFYFLN